MAIYRGRRDFAATIDAVAERLGVSSAIVEKDYWVTQALRVLARDFSGDFIFKGGTSLSKGYGLIERFSEDVDILIIQRDSKNATHTLMKQMADAVETELGGPVIVESSTTGIHRNARVMYPARKEQGGLQPGVLLEAGVRGGPQPCERLSIGCLIGSSLGDASTTYEDLRPFDVDVLHPGRTLMEKLSLLHSRIGVDAEAAGVLRYVRHYYDVHQLLGDDRVLEVLRDRAEFERILESMRQVNDQWYGGAEVRPATGWATSAAFDTGGPHYENLRAEYDATMAELYLGRQAPPALDVIYARIAELADLL